MNAKERIKRTINRQEADKIPYSFDMTSVIMNKLSVHYGVEPGRVHDRIGANLKYVNYTYPSDFQPERVNESQYRDEFGVIWNKSEKTINIGDWGGIISSPLKEPDISAYKFPDPKKSGRFKGLNERELLDTNRELFPAERSMKYSQKQKKDLNFWVAEEDVSLDLRRYSSCIGTFHCYCSELCY